MSAQAEMTIVPSERSSSRARAVLEKFAATQFPLSRAQLAVRTPSAATRTRARWIPRRWLVVPREVAEVLERCLQEMAKGNAITLVPVDAELTTQKAADLLNISRPTLVQLLEQNKIPFHRIGRHRRIKLADLIAFKKEQERASRDAVKKLTNLAQQLDAEY